MDFDSVMNSSRWDILKMIALEPASPVKISEEIGTSVAYVSQQLKLLEVAGVLRKKRTGSSERGKPRTVYSIAKELVSITSLIDRAPGKIQFEPNSRQKAMIAIWSLPSNLHYLLEKLHWTLDGLSGVRGIYFESSSKSRVFVISESKKVKDAVMRFSSKFKEVDFSVLGDSSKLRGKDFVKILDTEGKKL